MMLVGVAVSLAAAPAGTKVFSEELDVYWRYTASGHSTLAYYLGKTISSFPRILLAGLHFSAVLYYLASPVVPFGVLFGVIGLFFFGVYGLCSFVSMLVRRENATLLTVVVALFSAVFCGYGLTIKNAKSWGIYFVWAGQFNMWGAQAFFSETLKVYEHVYDSDAGNAQYGYQLNQSGLDLALSCLIGLAWRVLGYF